MKDWTPSAPSGRTEIVQRVIGFGVPIHESVEGHAFMALAMTWASWLDIAPAEWKLKVGVSRGCSVAENRNRIAAELLKDGGHDAPESPLTNRAADVIVWNDSDCLVEPEEYIRLVESLLAAPPDVAAIGYAFPMQSGTDRPRPNVGRASGPISFRAPGPVAFEEVDWIGFGVVATRAEAYPAITALQERRDDYPQSDDWFSHTSGKAGRGEDIGWCRDVRDAGFRIFCDVGVLGTHCYRAPHRLDSFYAQHHREG